MIVRSDDSIEDRERIHALRKMRLSDSSAAAAAGVIALVISLGGIAYSSFFVKFEADQSVVEIQSLKQWNISHEAKDEVHAAQMENRLERIEEKLDVLIGRVDGAKR